MMTKRIPFGQINTAHKNAVFLAIYVEDFAPWKYFKDQMNDLRCPGVIMLDRWDGRSGFPGGTLEVGESLLDALVREVKEEIGITIKPHKVKGIASHEGKIVTHLYGLNVTEMEFFHLFYHILNNFSRSILLHSYEEPDESHFMSEITGIKIVPLVEHHGKGINKFLENSFAGASREDLLIFMHETLGMNVSSYF
jgi:8-oxo-dGTP pyrophosphatase MutT (NUDIX family)